MVIAVAGAALVSGVEGWSKLHSMSSSYIHLGRCGGDVAIVYSDRSFITFEVVDKTEGWMTSLPVN